MKPALVKQKIKKNTKKKKEKKKSTTASPQLAEESPRIRISVAIFALE